MTAADIQRIKDLLPTSLGSDELRSSIASDILRRSVFSARMESARYLARIREVCAQVSEGSINQATARARLLEALAQMGHSPLDGGGLSNPASIRRLNLIVDTQRQMAASVSRLHCQTPAVLERWPAWELTRLVGKAVPREDWPARWRNAGESIGWEGALKDRFIALKTSPIWQALGDGAGGFRDTLGNPYPPFAYSSGMAWVAVDRETCERLGLSGPEPETVPSASLSPAEKDIADAASRLGFTLEDLAEGLE